MARLSQKATSTKRLEAAMPPRFSYHLISPSLRLHVQQSNQLHYFLQTQKNKLNFK